MSAPNAEPTYEVVRPPISSALFAVWALFVGLGIMLAGHGLQSTLVGLRATIEKFPAATVGVIMTGFYVGYVVGARVAPRLVQSVGHVRTFGALAALAGVTSLLHALVIDPYAWMVVRFVTGICLAGLTVVIESWLNDRATNEMRGRVLATYVVVLYLAVMAGNLLLNVADPAGWQLFALAAMLFSIAVIPVLLSASPAPSFHAPGPVSVKRLFKASPLGVAGVFVTGMSNGAFFGMAAVFAGSIGLSVEATSLFITSLVLGGIIMQWPIGWFSDRLDRRWVLAGVTLGAAAVALVGALSPVDNRTLLYGIAFALGGLSLPMYSLSSAHTNDFVPAEDMVASAGGLAFANGAGAIFGPAGAAAAMALIGPRGLFWYLVLVHGVLGVYAFWRMTRRATVPIEEHVPSVPLAIGSSHVVAEQAAEYAAEAAHEVAPHDDESDTRG